MTVERLCPHCRKVTPHIVRYVDGVAVYWCQICFHVHEDIPPPPATKN